MPQKPTTPPKRPDSGLSLFLMYVFLYGGFIFGCVFRPDIMARRVYETVTLSVVYGMLLIVMAAILALLYLRRKK
jgi:uncharacterized membrane protein (DUF485 family)